MFHLLTGWYCPGCGGTRAVLALLHGQLWRSFVYHPIVPYAAVLCLYIAVCLIRDKLTHKKQFRFHPAWLWVALAIVVVNCVVKNVALACGVDLLAR